MPGGPNSDVWMLPLPAPRPEIPVPVLPVPESALSHYPSGDLETIRLIDQRQDQVLEDLEHLNQRILDIIELYTANGQPDAGVDVDGDRLDSAA